MNERDKRLFDAIKSNDLGGVKQALQDGADVTAKDADGMTPLHEASMCSNTEVADLLIKRGADVNAQTNHGNFSGSSPLHLCVLCWNYEGAELLISNRAMIDIKDAHGRTPLANAIFSKRLKIAELLINHNADLTTQDNKGKTLLELSVHDANLDRVTFLIDKGITISTEVGSPMDKLSKATSGSLSQEAVKLLIKHVFIKDSGLGKPGFLANKELSDLWDKCLIEIPSMQWHTLGTVDGQIFTLRDFLMTKDSTKLIKCFKDDGISAKLKELKSNNFRQFPTYADLLHNKIKKGKEIPTSHVEQVEEVERAAKRVRY